MEYKDLAIKNVCDTDTLEIDIHNIATDALYGSLFIRNGGNFDRRSYFLSSAYDWVMGRDSTGALILVPLKKS